MNKKSVDHRSECLEPSWDRVYPIPLPPFPLDPLFGPRPKASNPSSQSANPNRLSRQTSEPQFSKSAPQHRSSFHLGYFENWVSDFRNQGSGLWAGGIRLQTLETRFRTWKLGVGLGKLGFGLGKPVFGLRRLGFGLPKPGFRRLPNRGPKVILLLSCLFSLLLI
jgi:hypothetical protein